MSLSKNYRFHSGQSFLSHGPQRPLLFGDYADDQGITYLDALVASGKCLFTLATELDEAVRLLPSQPDIARPRIERLARTLQQLESGYTLIRKPAEP